MPFMPAPLLLGFASFLSAPPVWLSPASGQQIVNQNEGTPVSVQLSATHPLGPVTYSITSGSLPPGLTLNSQTGLLSGLLGDIPDTTTYSITVRASAPVPANTFTNRSFTLRVASVYADSTVISHLRLDGSTNTAMAIDLTAQTSWTVIGGQIRTDNTAASNRLTTPLAWNQYFSNAETSSPPSGYLQMQHTSLWPATSDMTLEFFARRAVMLTAEDIFGIHKGAASLPPFLTARRNQRNTSLTPPITEEQVIWNAKGNLVDRLYNHTDRWHHVAIQRQSGVSTLFVNGMWVNLPQGIPNNPSPLSLPADVSFGAVTASRGRVDEIRLSSVARYSRTFSVPTAPLPTAASEPLPNTIVLHHRLDNSTPIVGPSGTVTGMTYGEAGPFAGTTAARFSGTGSSITLDPWSAVDNNTGLFSIEFWMRPAITASRSIFRLVTSSSVGAITLNHYIAGGNSVLQFINPVTSESSTTSFTDTSRFSVGFPSALNRWCHVVINRDDKQLQMYADGVRVATDEIGRSVIASGGGLIIGGGFDGALYDFRATFGAIRRPYVPPFQPFPA